MGEERAETYLRLLGEAELHRAGDQLRGLDAAIGTVKWSDPDMAPFAAAESAQWKVVRAGRILVAAGALDQDDLLRFAADLSMLEAERILASGDARGPAEGPVPGEIITVLTQAGAIAADSPLPGQLAALCQRLGAAGHGITVPPAQQIPAQWASVLAQRDAPVPPDGPEVFAPLAGILPDVDGARFALAGLSTAAGESHLHVVASGMPQLTDRFAPNWTPGFSWWLRDGAGNWHVATAGEPCTLGDGTQAFGLRLTPPLAAVPDAAQVVVTGPATRIRATVPIHPAPRTSEA